MTGLSTIGPVVSSGLEMQTIDIGKAVLAMRSIRERSAQPIT
ncbi:MAG: hypothetical protein ABII93_07345 [Chrysiogenia bacterium]